MIGLLRALAERVMQRKPDFIIGGAADPYMLRWFITPWSGLYRDIPRDQKTMWQGFVSRLPCIYLHEFHRSDDDRALHDHPWVNCSIVLEGTYVEHTICAGGVHVQKVRQPGTVVLRRSVAAHRIEIEPGTFVRSLFITGPRLRDWGFHCPAGWMPWQKFTASDDRGAIGKGCGDG